MIALPPIPQPNGLHPSFGVAHDSFVSAPHSFTPPASRLTQVSSARRLCGSFSLWLGHPASAVLDVFNPDLNVECVVDAVMRPRDEKECCMSFLCYSPTRFPTDDAFVMISNINKTDKRITHFC